ncbi:uncharacterized protein TNCV_4079361 [Trichonephila clavipes]|nr:uncharacterized protein TNCV_4079361 [Trichonephila clavipes]
MNTKLHPKTVPTQASFKKVKSDPKRKIADSKIIASKLGMSSGTQIILEPTFEGEIPTLYGKAIDKFELHMDKTSSHTSKSTAACLGKKESETGIKCIPFDEVREKSPDAFSVNYCAFGLLK